jgi:hypothetical protein
MDFRYINLTDHPHNSWHPTEQRFPGGGGLQPATTMILAC